MKDLTVRRVLKDNKVPGTGDLHRDLRGDKGGRSPSPGAGAAAGFLGESQAELCEQPGACLDQGGLDRKNFSKRKRK